MSKSPDPEPDFLPTVKQSLQAAFRGLRAFELCFDRLQQDQETWAHHALESSLRAWLSAAGLTPPTTHELEKLSRALLQHPVESKTPAARQLQSLLDATTPTGPAPPGHTTNWLESHRAPSRHRPTRRIMSDEEKQSFHQEVPLAVHSFTTRAFELTGTSESDL